MIESSTSADFSVNGKTAIVTGAGSDINLRPEAKVLLESHGSVDGPRAYWAQTNVVNWHQLAHLFDVADKEFGGCDIVCPGAGVFEPEWSNFWHPPGTAKSKDIGSVDGSADHYALLDINLTHPIRTTQLAIARWMRAASAGHKSPKRIVHVSSVAANTPSLVCPMYAASKAAVSSFVKSLASLDEIGIRVSAVEPGIIKTPLWTEHPEKMNLLDDNQVWVEAKDVALAMLRCCEDDSLRGGCILTMQRSSDGIAEWDVRQIDPNVGSSAVSSARSQILDMIAQPGWGVPDVESTSLRPA